jgi:hypothetical protein
VGTTPKSYVAAFEEELWMLTVCPDTHSVRWVLG